MTIVGDVLPALALASGVAGAGLSAYGTYESGQASGREADYRAAIARNNAQIAEQRAQSAEKAGLVRSQNQSLKGAAQLARVKAGQAASGVDVNTGSAVDVQASEREANVLDAETVLHNANLEAYGYRTQGKNYEAQANLDEAQGEQSRWAGTVGAAGSLLSNASSLGLKWSGGQGGQVTGSNPTALGDAESFGVA